MSRLIIRDIEKIVGASKTNLHFLNIAETELRDNQRYPVCIALSKTAALASDLQLKNYDVTVVILEKMPIREPEDSDFKFESKIDARQEEFISIVEEIIAILVGEEFNFPYSIVGDVSFDSLSQFTDYELIGVRADFTLSERYNPVKCCTFFDQALLK